MIGAGAISTPVCVPFRPQEWNSNSSSKFLSGEFTVPPLNKAFHSSPVSNLTPRFNLQQKPHSSSPNFLPKAAASSSSSSSSSVKRTEYTEEPATKVRFQKSLALPGCSTSLALLGTGYREKVFAIIGVKVYAAGLYVNLSVLNNLDAWKGQSAAKIQEDKLLFDTIFQASLEKSLQIVLVRDVDGKTFWDALDEAISPRVKSPTSVDETALSTYRSIFQGRPLKKGTSIFLTWLDPTKMLVHVSSDGVPSSVNATIESANVTSALFDVFLGSDPVSPPLKASVANSLASTLK